MCEVKRYHIVQDYTKAGDYMKEFDDGRCVKHSDHLATVQALQARIVELEEGRDYLKKLIRGEV